MKHAVEKGTYVQKAEAIRNLIDRIVCHWESVPTTDGRYKNGLKTICRAITVESSPSAKDADGKNIEMMTIETPTGWSSQSQGRIRWILAHPRLFVRRVFEMTVIAV